MCIRDRYGLILLRIRGKEREDRAFITNDFIRCFKKGSTPTNDTSAYPTAEEIRATFDAVFARCLDEMQSFTSEVLAESLPAPTAVYENKLGSILFCPMHEMLHAGQIGALRRQLGKEPIR